MKFIVGLGNPGKQYAATRHNVGFMAIAHLAAKWNIAVKQQKFNSLCGEGQINGTKVLLAQPQTYMNLSGEAIRAIMDFYKVDRQDLVVIYDDMDTATGKIRLRYQGGAGGHNGIKSIIQHLATQEFNRIRIGISRPDPDADIVGYVLSSFPKAEVPIIQDTLLTVADAIEFALEHSFDKVMAKFNSGT